MTEKVNHAGLMRCCLQSLSKQREGAPPVTEGQIVVCEYCKDEMVFTEDVWRWNNEYPRVAQR